MSILGFNIISRKFKIIFSAVFIAVFCALVVFLFATGRVQPIISTIISNFPFFDFIYSTYEKFSGFDKELPQLTWNNETSHEMIKLVITTAVSGLLFALASKIFLNIGIARNQILFDGSAEYEQLEEKEKSFSYRIKKFFVSASTKIIAIFLCGAIMSLLKNTINRISSEISQTVVYAIILILVLAVYCVLYSFFTRRSISFSFCKTLIFNFLPKLVENFVTTAIMLLIYLHTTENGFTWKTIIELIALFLWCEIADWICKKISAIFAGVTLKEKRKICPSNFIAFLYLYLMMFLTYFFGYYIGGYTAVFEDLSMKPILNLPALPFFEMLAEQQSITELISCNTTLFFEEVIKSFLLSVLLSTLLKLNKNSYGMKGYSIDSTLLFCTIVSYSLILFCWEIVPFFPMILISVIIILMLFKKFHEAFNIIEILILTLITIISAVLLGKIFTPEISFSLLLASMDLVCLVAWRLVRKIA